MTGYSEIITKVKGILKDIESIKTRLDQLEKSNNSITEEIELMLEVQKVLSTISDDNLSRSLDYITDIINKALSEIFKNNPRRVSLKKELYAGKHSHIVLELVNESGKVVDITLSGTGLRQTISFLYTVAMIEILGGRKLFIMDELLSGVHPKAKKVLLDLMEIFASEGFQFIMVEYGVNNFGKMYLIENIKGTSTVSELPKEYKDEIFMEEVKNE